MSLNELFLAGAKPKRIQPYTSGTGTYVPTVDMARCFVRIQAGGGGGQTTTYAGGGGAMTEWWIRIPIAGLPYVVGAGGAANADGALSSLGPYKASPGKTNTLGQGPGGATGYLTGSADVDGVALPFSGVNGISGGAGGYTGAYVGQCAGSPAGITTSNGAAFNTSMPPVPTNGLGNGSGGDSFYGQGGVSGASPVAGAYGAGGGVNAAGAGGYIEIWDFGA